MTEAELGDIILKTAVTTSIGELIKTHISPKIKTLKGILGDGDYDKIPTEANFKEYLHRTYKRVSILNTLVFKNRQKLLRDIYLPLNIYKQSDDKKNYKIDSFPTKLLDEHNNVLIVDTAGMGKSTLMKRIFLDIVDSNEGLPILVELRRLSKDKSLIDLIKEHISSINKNIDNKLLMDMLSEGDFIIMLDGYDEIPLSDREVVTADIQDFIHKASDNRYFLTSRQEDALSSFGNFQEFRIRPLSKKDAYELLRKYDLKIASLLIKRLQESDDINEFLINPLLVTLLFTAFEHTQKIPLKKHLFYRQVYDANFETHDLTKGDSYSHDKKSKLDIDDFHRVMRALGYFSLKAQQKTEFSKDELLKFIKESREFSTGINFSDSHFLEDLLKSVPLFSRDGNYYRWAHKSLMEYFASQFIYMDTNGKQKNILSRFYNSENIHSFINIFDMYYDIDYKIFRNEIEYSFLKEYESFCKNHYEQTYNGVNTEEQIKRKEITFMKNYYIFSSEKDEGTNFFPDKDFDVIHKQLISIYPKLSSFGISSPTGSKVFVISINKTKNIFMSLFRKKNNEIVKNYIPTKVEHITYIIDGLDNLKVIEVDDNQNSIINNSKYFELINNLVSGTNTLVINHEMAFMRLEQIRKDLNAEKDFDFTFN